MGGILRSSFWRVNALSRPAPPACEGLRRPGRSPAPFCLRRIAFAPWRADHVVSKTTAARHGLSDDVQRALLLTHPIDEAAARFCLRFGFRSISGLRNVERPPDSRGGIISLDQSTTIRTIAKQSALLRVPKEVDMKSMLKCGLVAAAALCAALPGHAVTVFSSSFEDGAFVDNDASAQVAMKLALNSTAITGWTVTAGAASDAVTWINEPSFWTDHPKRRPLP